VLTCMHICQPLCILVGKDANLHAYMHADVGIDVSSNLPIAPNYYADRNLFGGQFSIC